jgi:hypothetical protein
MPFRYRKHERHNLSLWRKKLWRLDRGYQELCKVHFCRTMFVDISNTTILTFIWTCNNEWYICKLLVNYGFKEAYFESCNFSRENTNIDVSVFMVDLRMINMSSECVYDWYWKISACSAYVPYLLNTSFIYIYMYMLSGCESIDTENISLPSQNMKLSGEWAKQTSLKLHILSSRLIFFSINYKPEKMNGIFANYLWTMFCGSIFWIMWFFPRKYKYRCICVYVWFKDDKHVIWMWIWFINLSASALHMISK